MRAQGILTYRELIERPWRILYRVEANTVYVLALIDARRNVEDILLDRFVRSRLGDRDTCPGGSQA